jgi:hypothetical protein
MSDKRIETDEVTSAEPGQPEPEGYDAWFREQVELAVRESEAPDAVFHTMEEVDEEIAQMRTKRLAVPFEKAS